MTVAQLDELVSAENQRARKQQERVKPMSVEDWASAVTE